MGHRDHVGGIHHEHSHITMIGVIVVWTVTDDDVRLPVADQAADRPTVLHGHHEFTVVDVEHLGLVAKDAGALPDFRRAALSQASTRHAPMADVTVCTGHKFDMVTLRGPLCACSAGAEFAVVRVRPKNDDAQFAVTGRRLALRTLRRQRERRKRGRRDSRELEK